VRLGLGWAVLGAIVVTTTISRMPSPGVGAPIGSGWAVLIAGGAAVVVGGIVLAVSPVVRLAVPPAIVVAAVIAVVAVQIGGYAGAVGWTNGQNVHLSVADATPLRPHESALDGRVQWGLPGSGYVAASAGGVLATDRTGLQMFDPVTGLARWTYHRADLAQVVNPVASADGKLVGAIGLVASLNPKPAPQAQQRLLVLDAVSGAVVADVPLDTVQGTLSLLGPDTAYFTGGAIDFQQLQITSVPFTGSKAGRRGWIYYPKDGCNINGLSALGDEVVTSSSCGTVDMLDPATGKPRWHYRAPQGGVQVWPLAGTPTGTVLAVTSPGPVGGPTQGGLTVPGAIVTLDARTGAVRAQYTNLPTAPFTADSQDAAIGALTLIWANGTAVLAYDLADSARIWLIGYRPGATPGTWTTTVPGVAYGAAFGLSIPLDTYINATPDGRIVMATQHLQDADDLDAHPVVIVVDGKDGHVRPQVVVNGPQGLGKSTGFFGAPTMLPTPGGTVMAIPGSDPSTGDPTPKYMLVGLN
jgi:outer membrane protein assembly factor BamB